MRDTIPALRQDYKKNQASANDNRSIDRIIAHYILEHRLARHLLESDLSDRAKVYSEVYAELFRDLPDHPQAIEKTATRARRVHTLLALLIPLLGRDKTFLEVGCGDAVLSAAIAPYAARSYALDVTDALIDRSTMPQNLDCLITSGTEIPLPERSIDVALSDQLMEHLHPDDVTAQLKEIFRVLRFGGTYHCITPNRVTGPHDISRLFGYEASGFHLREYDSSSLLHLFEQAGFRRVRFIVPLGRGFKLPIARPILRALEKALLSLPRGVRGWAARCRVIGIPAGLHVIATK